jgi:predicted GIY-YIG superfamily endonuclease
MTTQEDLVAPEDLAIDEATVIEQDFLFGSFLRGLPEIETAGTPLGGTAVYRFFDLSGDLLYVGIAGNLGQRWQEHSSSKAWYADIHSMTAVWYRTRELAIAAESEAIVDEMPRYNEAGNPNPRQRPRLRSARRRRPRATPEVLKARAAYRKSVRDGKPLSDRALGAMFGHARTWGAKRIKECNAGPHLAAKTG